MDEVTGDRQEVHNEELHILHSPPYIIRVIKPSVRWVWYVASMGETNTFWVSMGGTGRKDTTRLTLKWKLQKQGGMA